jgi:hypothetical protein
MNDDEFNQLTDDDRSALRGIADEQDPHGFVDKVHSYYANTDRANRTPRALLYLHLGMSAGHILRLLERPRPILEAR